jgi:hypothetical protein
VNPALVQRQAALAGVALLATLGALALDRWQDEPLPSAPDPTSVTGQPWQEAVAGVLAPADQAQQTACGVELRPDTRGVAHPVLPCGVDLVVSFEDRQVRAEVIERGPFEGGREFDLTQALARELGFEGTDRIRWRFAG